MVDLDDRVLDFILFRNEELRSTQVFDVGSLTHFPMGEASGSFMLSGGVFKFGTGWGNNLKELFIDFFMTPAGEACQATPQSGVASPAPRKASRTKSFYVYKVGNI